MLYASQWFLTIYSCPFPATFACRVIDVMLTEHSSNVLMRAALAVLAECEDDLLQLHDFEDLITYLKVGMSCELPLPLQTSMLIQKGHLYTGNLKSETPGDRKLGFYIVEMFQISPQKRFWQACYSSVLA